MKREGKLILLGGLALAIALGVTTVITFGGSGPRPHVAPAYGQTDADGDGICLTYDSTDTPINIPDGTDYQAGLPWGTIISTITVPDTFTVIDANVTLNIGHPYDSDLQATLISPATTEVLLFSGVGRDGDSFWGTILNDECATGIEQWPSAAPPYTGCFNPQGLLSVVDGEGSSGSWSLRVSDRYLEDTGTLQSWQLELCGAPEPTSTFTPTATPTSTFTPTATPTPLPMLPRRHAPSGHAPTATTTATTTATATPQATPPVPSATPSGLARRVVAPPNTGSDTGGGTAAWTYGMAAVAAGVVALGVGGWYARRRWQDTRSK